MASTDAKFQAVSIKLRELSGKFNDLTLENRQVQNELTKMVMEVSKQAGPAGPKGERGEPGKDAPPPKEPREPVDGKDAPKITDIWVAADNHLMFGFDDGNEIDAGELPVGQQQGGDTYVTQKIVSGGSADVFKFDDYSASEYLDEVLGDGTVKTLTFSQNHQFIVIEMVSTLDQDAQATLVEAQEGRVTSGVANTPTSTRGAILKHEVPVTLLDNTDTVKVLAPTDTRIVVYGLRR